MNDSSQDGALRRGRGRPPVITNDDLLTIARDVFLARGIRATAAEVAERAGVSEGTIFHRFGSKDALFRSAMRFDPRAEPPVGRRLKEAVPSPDLHGQLVEIAEELVAFGRVALPVMMMSWSNPSSEFALEKLAARKEDRAPKRLLGALEGFFARHLAAGTLAEGADTKMLARVMLGAIHHYCLMEIVDPASPSPPTPAFVDSLARLVVRGAGHSPRARAPHRLSRKKKTSR